MEFFQLKILGGLQTNNALDLFWGMSCEGNLCLK